MSCCSRRTLLLSTIVVALAAAWSGTSLAGGAKRAAPASSGSPLSTDADMRAVLDEFVSFKPRAIEELSPEEARLQPTFADAVLGELRNKNRPTDRERLVPGVTSTDRLLPVGTANLPSRIFTPNGAVGPLPVVVYFHGGGFVVADRDVYDSAARGIAKHANAIVVSVDYRLAPEHKFPAAHDDAFAAYKWVAKNAASFGGDPRRLALAGESSGGNLAIATAIAVRDAYVTPPYAILAIYPIGQTSTTTRTYETYRDARPLNRPMMSWFLQQYVRTPADLRDTRLDIVHANLRGLPPVMIISAEVDPLRDDGAMLDGALQIAGVQVTRKVYSGVTHEFFGSAALVKKAAEAQALAGAVLKASL